MGRSSCASNNLELSQVLSCFRIYYGIYFQEVHQEALSLPNAILFPSINDDSMVVDDTDNYCWKNCDCFRFSHRTLQIP